MTALRRLASPVLTRGGRFSVFKATTLGLIFIPGVWLLAQYLAGALGARPVLALVHGFGLWTLRLLLITLALTPARSLLNAARLNLVRRMLGVATAAYGGLHLALYAAQQNWHLGHVASEIWRRVYLTIGFGALVLLLALAATSTDGMMRALGRNWKRLHRLAYGIAVLGLVHYFMQAKAEVYEAAIAAGLFVWLMAWRALPPAWRGKPVAPVILLPVGMLGTAGLEYAWYAAATRVPAGRVWAANFHLTHWRPAIWTGLWGAAALAVVVLVAAVRGWRRDRVAATSAQPVASMR